MILFVRFIELLATNKRIYIYMYPHKESERHIRRPAELFMQQIENRGKRKT